jgi:hypothetical protein
MVKGQAVPLEARVAPQLDCPQFSLVSLVGAGDNEDSNREDKEDFFCWTDGHTDTRKVDF